MNGQAFPMAQWLSRTTGLDHPDPASIRDWQMARIRETVALARRASPFYREHLGQVRPESLRSPSDLGPVPRTTGDHLRERPEALLCASQDEVARVVTLPSSGTTGPAKRLFFTAEDLESTVEYFHRGLELMLELGQNALILLPGAKPDSVGQLLARAVHRLGARALLLGPLASAPGDMSSPAMALDLIRATPVHCLIGSSAHLNILAALWTAAGLDCGISPVRTALLCWDAVPKAVTCNLDRAFGCRCHRHWGMVETGLGGAVECAYGTGPHLREADLFVEIVDPQSGEPLPDGQWGEITVTTLTRAAMPLVRYRSGDRGRILPESCPCGSPLRRLDPDLHRLDEPPGPSMAELAEALYGLDGLADFTALRQDDHLTIKVCVAGQRAEILDLAREAVYGLEGVRGQGIEVRVELLPHDGPAEPGLGKRRIQHTEDSKDIE